MTPERQAYIQTLAALPAKLRELTSGLSESQLTTPFLAGEWTVAQNVHHLLDSHINSYIRCRLALTEDNPPFKPYKADDWAALPDAMSADLDSSLRALEGIHARWVQFWNHLDDADWSRAGQHPENGEMSLDTLLRVYANHCDAHIDQITRTLAAQG